MLCYIEKNSEAVKLCQDPDKLFDKTKPIYGISIWHKKPYTYTRKTGVRT